MADMTTKGVTVCEGDADKVVEFKSVEEARAYADGFRDGAYSYGAGSARVLLQADWDDLDDDERAIVREHLGEP